MALYLVTGGAGFIGSHITEELLRLGEHVRVFDDFSTGKRENLRFPELEAKLKTSCEIVEGDVRDSESVCAAMHGVDYVLHQAALPSVARSVIDPLSSHAVNVTGTLNILLAAREEHVKRVVYASSSSVYGNSASLPKHEKMPTEPLSPYAVSKLAGERYCVAFHEVYDTPTVCIRYFNVFGPRQDPSSEYSAVIPKFITVMLRGERPLICGDGLQSRDFTYVTNVVRANLLACEREEAIGCVMNVACGKRYTLLDLHRELVGLTGADVAPVFVAPRPGDVRHSMASIDLATEKIGYHSEVDWLGGLKKTVDWYRGRC
jgi:UDP-glucose 4-epimerase